MKGWGSKLSCNVKRAHSQNQSWKIPQENSPLEAKKQSHLRKREAFTVKISNSYTHSLSTQTKLLACYLKVMFHLEHEALTSHGHTSKWVRASPGWRCPSSCLLRAQARLWWLHVRAGPRQLQFISTSSTQSLTGRGSLSEVVWTSLLPTNLLHVSCSELTTHLGWSMTHVKQAHVTGLTMCQFGTYRLKIIDFWDFPGGPVAKAPHSQCRGPRFDPGSGN